MPRLNSTHRAGALVFLGSPHQKRVIDAIGGNVRKNIINWASLPIVSADAPAGFTVTLVETGAGESTIAKTDANGGALALTTDAAENDGINMQRTGEAWQITTSQEFLYFYASFLLSEVLQSDFLVGLCITDTTLLGGLTDGIYFRKVDGSAAVEFVTEKDSSETATAAVHTMVDLTLAEFEFYADASGVEFFVNGVSVAKHTTNIPDDELLTESVHFLTGEAAAKGLILSGEMRTIMVNKS